METDLYNVIWTYPAQRLDVVQCVLRLQRCLASIKRDETATWNTQTRTVIQMWSHIGTLCRVKIIYTVVVAAAVTSWSIISLFALPIIDRWISAKHPFWIWMTFLKNVSRYKVRLLKILNQCVLFLCYNYCKKYPNW